MINSLLVIRPKVSKIHDNYHRMKRLLRLVLFNLLLLISLMFFLYVVFCFSQKKNAWAKQIHK